MKRIIINKLHLVNFKGFRDFEVKFDRVETNILGTNAAGKTTIFDAFSWLLFGKDSSDRKDFNLKTLGTDGKAIEKIPHEVSAELVVDGEIISLRKTYNEKWTKKSNSLDEVFGGHFVECFYNDVPMTLTDYNKKVDEICSEQTFKLITNPYFFTSQKRDVQRQMLFQLAGEVTTEDILNGADDLKNFVDLMTGKTLEEFKKEIAAKKKTIKEECKSIPARIDERKRSLPEEKNWAGIMNEIDQHKANIANLEEQIADVTKAYEEISATRQKTAEQIADLNTKIVNRKAELHEQLLADYNKTLQQYNEEKVKSQMAKSKAEGDVKLLEEKYNSCVTQIGECKRREEILENKRKDLLAQWHSIKAEHFDFDEEKCICPTCKRKLDYEDIQAKREEMEKDFNEDIAYRLEENKAEGLKVKNSIEGMVANIKTLEEEVTRLEIEINDAKAAAEQFSGNVEMAMPAKPNVEPIIAEDAVIKGYNEQIEELKNSQDAEVARPNTDEIKKKIAAEREEISRKSLILKDQETIKSIEDRIAELEKQYKECNAQLSYYEGLEMDALNFTKRKIEMIEGRINSMFKMVRFKMFETQINGNEVETCEATYNGIPFSDQNAATRLNMGLDIINAICNANDISAPIFIDNREGVVEIIPVTSQIVNLIVSKEHKTITIQ